MKNSTQKKAYIQIFPIYKPPSPSHQAKKETPLIGKSKPFQINLHYYYLYKLNPNYYYFYYLFYI